MIKNTFSAPKEDLERAAGSCKIAANTAEGARKHRLEGAAAAIEYLQLIKYGEELGPCLAALFVEVEND